MKRTHCYEVNHLMKTVVVTRRFLEEASQMGTPAADLMEQFIEKGFTVTVYHKAPRKAAKPENGKVRLKPEYPEIAPGSRNLSLTSLAGQMHNQGYGKAEIFKELLYANSVACKPPLDRSEVELIVNSVTKYRR